MLDTMATENSRKRRCYGEELKAQILAECDVPGTSVAKFAMAHGIDAGGITVKLSWPMSAAMDLSGWMRGLLR